MFGGRVIGRARGVHQGEHRDAEPVREADDAGGRTVARRAGGGAALGGVGHGAALAQPESAQHARVGAARPVPGERQAELEVRVQVRGGVRPAGVPGL